MLFRFKNILNKLKKKLPVSTTVAFAFAADDAFFFFQKQAKDFRAVVLIDGQTNGFILSVTLDFLR